MAFRGVRDRAAASSASTTAANYDRTLRMCYTLNQTLPGGGFVNEIAWGCPGTAADYPATADFPAGVCYKSVPRSTGVPFYYSLNPQLTTDLQSIVSRLPSASTPVLNINVGSGSYIYDESYRGIYYDFWNFPPGNSSNDTFQIVYRIKGDMPCGPDSYNRSVASDISYTTCITSVNLGGTGSD